MNLRQFRLKVALKHRPKVLCVRVLWQLIERKDKPMREEINFIGGNETPVGKGFEQRNRAEDRANADAEQRFEEFGVHPAILTPACAESRT